MSNNKTIFRFVNGFILIIGFVLLFFAAELWIGSHEDYNEIMMNSKFTFIAKKYLLSMLLSITIIAMVYLISRFIFRIDKSETYRIIKIDLVILLVISLLTVMYHHF